MNKLETLQARRLKAESDIGRLKAHSSALYEQIVVEACPFRRGDIITNGYDKMVFEAAVTDWSVQDVLVFRAYTSQNGIISLNKSIHWDGEKWKKV